MTWEKKGRKENHIPLTLKSMDCSPKFFQLFIESPDLPLPTKSLSLPSDSSISPSFLLSLLSLPRTLPPNSLYFTLNGRPLHQGSRLSSPSTVLLRFRLRGGGGDGGSTCAESRDCYLNMYSSKKPDKADPNEARLSKFTTCSLSNEPLNPPVVIDKLGNLFNKEALVQALIHKKQLPKEFSHIRGLKDMIEVKITKDFECPITGLAFNGKYGFFAIRKCGHLLSVKAGKELKSEEGKCLICGVGFEERERIVINGTEEEVKVLRERMEEEEKGRVKVKKDKKKKVEGTKRANEGEEKVGGEKRFKAIAPKNATKEVYASIFTSSRKGELKETYSCRALPLGRN